MRNRSARARGAFKMLNPLQYKRLLMLGLLLLAAFAGLGYRLVDLQVIRHAEFTRKSLANTLQELLLEPRRGDILDARGNLLATSIYVKTVCADPGLMGNRHAEVAHVLAPLLQENEAKLLQKLMPRLHQNAKGQNATNHYVRLKQKVPVEKWEEIQTAMKNLSFGLDEKKLSSKERAFYRNLRQKSVFAQDQQLRSYPNQALAAHVLGYASSEDGEVNDTPITQLSGKDGIELRLNSELEGVRGWLVTETDRQRRELVSWRDQQVQPRDGLNVVLTIDSVIQRSVELALAEGMEKHSPTSISAIVVRPRTGEILAMATLPNYDPNNPGAASADARRNRVITDTAEPGSTFKIVVVSAALNEQVVRLSDTFDCEHGHFYFAGRTLHDHEAYGVLSAEQVIAKSSNIGAAKIGIKLGEARLYDYMRNFGFGTRTDIPLQGEVLGRVYPVEKWSKVSIAQIPMGHGISVTRLQMIMAMCAIANGGVLMRPALVDRLEDREHKVVTKYSPQRVRRVMSETAARQMVTALKCVVSPEGTAPKAALEHYTVAGKTGTAQKVEHGVYVHDKFFSSFIGFFPADNPEICISVMIDEPKQGYYGGQTAAPIFKQIAERAANYLNIRPVDGDGTSIPDSVAGANENTPSKTAVAARSP
jgi:cell division protein FtsI/penicillin-binding protein 2